MPKNIRKLNLSWWEKLTDAAMKDLPRDLRKLDLSYCIKLTNAAFDDLPESLEEINLKGWSEEDLLVLQNLRNNVKITQVQPERNLFC